MFPRKVHYGYQLASQSSILKPSPLSLFISSITTGSRLHIARFDSGSRDRDFILLSEFCTAVCSADDNAISDLALTSLSDIGWTSCTPPPLYVLYEACICAASAQLIPSMSDAPLRRAQTTRTCCGSSFKIFTTFLWSRPSNRLPFTCKRIKFTFKEI